MAIRMKEPSQADLIRRRIMSVHMRLYASRAYLDSVGDLEGVEDLRHHRLICQRVNATQVSAGAMLVNELLSGEVGSTLTVNNYFGVLQAVLSNLGIGVLPDYVTEDFPDLVRVLPDVESAEVPVFLAYPEELASFEAHSCLPRLRYRRDNRLPSPAKSGSSGKFVGLAMHSPHSGFAGKHGLSDLIEGILPPISSIEAADEFRFSTSLLDWAGLLHRPFFLAFCLLRPCHTRQPRGERHDRTIHHRRPDRCTWIER